MFEKVVNQATLGRDLAEGQRVIIAARWILVLAGLMLAVWDPAEIGELRLQIILILGLAGANFYLHAQILTRKPLLPAVALAASAADIAVISLIIIAQGGDSTLFVFYFPALLVISVAFRPLVTLTFAGAAIAVYGMIFAGNFPDVDGQIVVTRMLMMAGVAVCGAVYWQLEQSRRREAEASSATQSRGVGQETSAS